MVERQTLAPDELRLRRFLADRGFVLGEHGWVSDNEQRYGDVTSPEILPLRVRIARDSSRLEYGVRRADVEALQALCKADGRAVGTIEQLIHFWDGDAVYSTRDEGEWIFVGCECSAGLLPIEQRWGPLHWATAHAIDAAVTGKDYAQQLADPEMSQRLTCGVRIDSDQKCVLDGSMDEIFSSAARAAIEAPQFSDRMRVAALPDTLADLPLARGLLISEMPSTLLFDGSTKTGTTYLFVGACDTGMFVSLSFHAEFDSPRRTIHLAFPANALPETVRGLAASRTQIEYYQESPSATRHSAAIKVEEQAITVQFLDPQHRLLLTVHPPTCFDCRLPQWKFLPENLATDAADDEGQAELEEQLGMGATRDSGGWRWYWTIEGRQELCCSSCLQARKTAYLHSHPGSDPAAAAEIAVSFLQQHAPDVATYFDAEYSDRRLENDGWDFYLRRRYDRAGLSIERNLGQVSVFDYGQAWVRLVHPTARVFGFS